MATIFIDNTPYEVKDGQNLLSACLSLGFNIPYFCWHPAMHAVGACRMCAIKQFRDENDTRGSIVMSCMTPAADGTRISIDDDDVREFRAGVIEFLMLNHPHDCPVCDEGGECHLQDMTVMSGHVYRRYRFRKRTYTNQDLGPFLGHEMNRCIQCYRCVRFYRDYAGGRDFNVFGIHDRLYFGRSSDGPLENEFSGNLVEVCPTGVFTDKTFRKHFTRKWDLQTAPSICPHCGLGCNTVVGERYGLIRRILNRYNHEVNGYFLCDRGRFGYEFVNSPGRVSQPIVRDRSKGPEDFKRPVQWTEILDEVAGILRSSRGIVGVGSPRATLEANFLLRSLVGSENFFIGMSDIESRMISGIIQILRNGPARCPSLREVELCDAVLILGEDVTNSAPRLALSLRQSVRQKPMEIADRLKIPRWADAAVRQAVQSEKGPLFILNTFATRLDDIAVQTFRADPNAIARLGFQVAHEINPKAPEVPDLEPDTRHLATKIATALSQASRPLVVSGTSLGLISVINASANIAWALCETGKKAGLFYTVPECNSLGLSLMGGSGLRDCFEKIRSDSPDTLLILENDLYRRAPSEIVGSTLEKCKHTIAIDHLLTKTVQQADFVLPCGTFAETTGSVVNSEGRIQRFYRVKPETGDILESHNWLLEIIKIIKPEIENDLSNIDNTCKSIAREFPIFNPILESVPTSEFRESGQKIPRQSHRFSGRTSILANINVHEPKPPDDSESPLSFSMEGYPGIPPASLIPRFWAPGWNSCQSVNKFQSEINGPLIGGDPGKRLIEPSTTNEWLYFNDTPATNGHREKEWLAVPKFHIFGSEELSKFAASISERAPDPCLRINPRDAVLLGKKEGETVKIGIDNAFIYLPVHTMESLPRGLVALPVGISELDGLDLPAWVKILENRDA
ncbi:MAG: NADH-quinone oxidoreductase subunit NuoG [Desulfomonilaceae bacterium]